jgi:hypothetical protein
MPGMNLGKHIFGLREHYFEKVDQEVRDRQFLVYNLLALMFYILVISCITSGIVYGLIIFNNWLIAIFVGLFFGLISFTLLILVLFLTMTTNHEDLYDSMTNMNPHFEPYQNKDLSSLSDEQALKITQEKKMFLRETSHPPSMDRFHLSGIITSIIKVSLILIISCIVANAMEILMFHGKLNDSLKSIKENEFIQFLAEKDTEKPEGEDNSRIKDKQLLASWTLEMLTEDKNQPFILVDSKSLILSIEILNEAIGKSKIVLDVLFALLFLTPFVLVKKSREYSGGAFLKEVALTDISTSFYSFLLTQRTSQNIKKKIELEFDYSSIAQSKKHEKG